MMINLSVSAIMMIPNILLCCHITASSYWFRLIISNTYSLYSYILFTVWTMICWCCIMSVFLYPVLLQRVCMIHYVSDLHLYGCSKEAQIKALQALGFIMIQLNVMSSFYSSYWICLYYQYKSCCMFLYSLQRIGFVCLCYCWVFFLLIRICTPCF